MASLRTHWRTCRQLGMDHPPDGARALLDAGLVTHAEFVHLLETHGRGSGARHCKLATLPDIGFGALTPGQRKAMSRGERRTADGSGGRSDSLVSLHEVSLTVNGFLLGAGAIPSHIHALTSALQSLADNKSSFGYDGSSATLSE